MFYEKDFARFREHINNLQIFSRKVHNREERRQYFQKFSDNFTLHGFSYIFYRNLNKFERYFWAICVTTAIISTIYVVSMLSGTYSDRALITVVESSQYPVFSIEFPAVAVCMKHRINWGRFQLARTKFLPPDASNATVEMFTSFVKRIDSLHFRTFDYLAGLEEEPLHLIDSISITKLATYLAFRCDEVFYGTCMWSKEPFDCCKLFIQEKTNMGMCLVFNSVLSEESEQKSVNDKFYPYKNSKNGEGSGLIFTIKRNVSNIIPGVGYISGIELMIKRSDQWTDKKTFHLRPNTKNGVMVKPEITHAHNDLKAFPPSFRNCLYQYETWKRYFIPGLKYRQWNCRSQCQQDYVIRACNCTIPLFFSIRIRKTRECTASDYICIYKNKDLFSNGNPPNLNSYIRRNGRGMDCPCPDSCDSLQYPISLNTVPLYNNSLGNTTIRVDIYYQSEVMMKYLTTLKFTSLDLFGYFGGLVTLFLGASIISAVEFLQFSRVELVSYLQEKARNRKIAKKINPRQT